MYLPTFTIKKIDPELNARFITNYLSKEKQANTSRPFFDKTISLYPELAGVGDIADEDERRAVIREAVLKRLSENHEAIGERMEHFREVFDKFIYKNIEAQCRLFGYEWSEQDPEICCYVGYLPFYPRSAEDKCFFVSYQDEERVFAGAVHEINHMIFWGRWKELHGAHGPEPAYPDPLWYLEEILVDPTLNDARVRPYTLYDNKAYPQFYEKNAKGGLSIMDRVKACYELYKDDMAEFFERAYEIVAAEYAGN